MELSFLIALNARVCNQSTGNLLANLLQPCGHFALASTGFTQLGYPAYFLLG